jgi:hypothetical protein
MGLVDLLFRCPFCGHDPLEGTGPKASCPGCLRRFEPGSGGARIRVSGRNGPAEELVAQELVRRLEALGGALPRSHGEAGRIVCRTRARARFATVEEPVWFGGSLLGFAERFGEAIEGRLELAHDRLVFRATTREGAEGNDGDPRTWSWQLLDLGALQTSSASVQISPREGGVILFRFPEDSARRWEELLKIALQRAWQAEDRGEILEFQPRIRSR